MIIDFIRRKVDNKVIFCHYVENPKACEQAARQNEIFTKSRVPLSNKQLTVVINEGNPAKLFRGIIKALSGEV